VLWSTACHARSCFVLLSISSFRTPRWWWTSMCASAYSAWCSSWTGATGCCVCQRNPIPCTLIQYPNLKLMIERIHWLLSSPGYYSRADETHPCLGPLPRLSDARMPHVPRGLDQGDRRNHTSAQPILSPILQFGRYSAQPTTSPQILSADSGS